MTEKILAQLNKNENIQPEENVNGVENHILIREPEYLSTLEVVTSSGFINLMSMILIPTILAGVCIVSFLKKIEK